MADFKESPYFHPGLVSHSMTSWYSRFEQLSSPHTIYPFSTLQHHCPLPNPKGCVQEEEANEFSSDCGSAGRDRSRSRRCPRVCSGEKTAESKLTRAIRARIRS